MINWAIPQFYKSRVYHKRMMPRCYDFNFNFFWFGFSLKQSESLHQAMWGFAYRKFSLFSFFDEDHVKIDKLNLFDGISSYAKMQGVKSPVKDIYFLGQLRCLGYVFNPICLFFIKDTDDINYCCAQVGNTFNELKLFWLGAAHSSSGQYSVTCPKDFYVSPFTEVDQIFKFHVQTRDGISVRVESLTKTGELILLASYHGKPMPWTKYGTLKMFVLHPLISLQVITMIHLHALILWVKKFPYYKKTEKQKNQTGVFPWKT